MTDPDLATLLRQQLGDEPPLTCTSTDVIRTARRQRARHGALAGGLAVAAVAAVALAPSLSTSAGRDAVPATGADQPAPVTDVMEAAATAGFAPLALGEPSWSVNDVLGDPVDAGDPDAQHYLLSYRPTTGPTQLNLSVGGFALEDLKTYDFAGACRAQLEQRRAESCTMQTLEDGSLLMTSVALRSGIDTDAPRMLTAQEARALPRGSVSRVRVVSLSTMDGMAVDAAEYVPLGARWSIPLDDLQALALDPGLRAAEVAHEPMPAFTDE